MRLISFIVLVSLLLLPGLVLAEENWLEIGGDYRFRYDSLRGDVHEHYILIPARMMPNYYSSNYYLYEVRNGMPVFVMGTDKNPVDGYTAKNDSLLTNRFGLNLRAKALEDVTVKARLLMYKVWGHETEGPVQGQYFADRAMGVFDGSIGHVPKSANLIVDYAYATWSNIADAPVWFSVGRRPSTGGVPTNLRQNVEKTGSAGVPGFLIDYAFDGMTLGVAPDIEALPGAYAKLCYGKGYDSGFKTDRPGDNTPKDVNMFGINVVPYDTDNLHIELQWNRAFDIFDNMPDSGVRTNLGDIDQYGALVMGKVLGNLNLFIAGALSQTHPNDNLFTFAIDGDANGTIDMPAGAGLLYNAGNKKSHTGNLIYLGARYDIPTTGTKIGAEYNRGSKYWVAFAPAGDDIWTSKLGTRGSVYEVYVIQELKNKPISKRGKAFFRLGYQYYDFEYTGSNSWIGEPVKISDLSKTNPMTVQMFSPLDKAHDIYLTFDVQF
jgi:hypothetical protein